MEYEITVDGYVIWSQPTTYTKAMFKYGDITEREFKLPGLRTVAIYEGDIEYPIHEEECGLWLAE